MKERFMREVVAVDGDRGYIRRCVEEYRGATVAEINLPPHRLNLL